MYFENKVCINVPIFPFTLLLDPIFKAKQIHAFIEQVFAIRLASVIYRLDEYFRQLCQQRKEYQKEDQQKNNSQKIAPLIVPLNL